MMKILGLLVGGTLFVSAPALADVRYLKCDMQTTFRSVGIAGVEWEHREGRYTKFFKIDENAKVVSLFNMRGKGYLPVCAGDNCSVQWADGEIAISGLSGPSASATNDIDFRKSFHLSAGGTHAVLVTADFGGGAKSATTPNMTWTQEGDCIPATADEAKPMPYPPGPRSATFVDAPAFPVSDAERDKALASRYGNTVTGLSGGRLWFHMWFFRDGIGYTGDDDDITAEGAVRQWYVGKEENGAYRLCERPVSSTGTTGCYPLNQPSIGDRWIEHDVYGDANFELRAGRQ